MVVLRDVCGLTASSRLLAVANVLHQNWLAGILGRADLCFFRLRQTVAWNQRQQDTQHRHQPADPYPSNQGVHVDVNHRQAVFRAIAS